DVNGTAGSRTKTTREGGITARPMPGAVVLTDDHPANFYSAQQPLHEGCRTERGDLRREGDHHHVVEAELVEQPDFFVESGEIRGAVIRVEHAARMWLERDQHAGGAGRAGTADERLQQSPVAAVNKIGRASCRGGVEVW